eukprot:TRINITY_DN12479_c1_g1_i1.p6 TRINITY_DN12479_c1_g1~~TRINITY_DN12479_c1_g1_i1.p6  ORF type:complete len:122 (+),score=12.47 TRINITY_DN12479_c1_g1_i1:5704-6069(+)
MVAFCRRVADGNIHLSQRVSDDNTSQSFLIGMALQLKIRTLNESNFDVELGVEQVQVDDLKAAIAAVQSQWPVDRQRLLYRGQVLESGHALAEYGKLARTTLARSSAFCLIQTSRMVLPSI